MGNMLGGAENLSLLQEIAKLRKENNQVRSDLKLANEKIDMMSNTSRVLFMTCYNYTLKTPIEFNPISDNGYFVICFPDYHNINTFNYNIQLIRVWPNEKSFSVDVLWNYNGTPTTKGTYDLELIFIPIQI